MPLIYSSMVSVLELYNRVLRTQVPLLQKKTLGLLKKREDKDFANVVEENATQRPVKSAFGGRLDQQIQGEDADI